jgi:hypothetical protein
VKLESGPAQDRRGLALARERVPGARVEHVGAPDDRLGPAVLVVEPLHPFDLLDGALEGQFAWT